MTQARDLGDAANLVNYLDNVTSDIQAQIDAIGTPQSTPAGIIQPFGGTTAPTGYLACEGQLVSKTGFPDLWTAIGDTWGTSTASSFYVPDLRAAFLRGTGTSATHNKADGNDMVGQAVGSFATDSALDHKHYLLTNSATNATHYGTATRYLASGAEGSANMYSTSTNVQNSASISSAIASSYGSRFGDETRPFNAGVLYIIKT